MFGSHVVKSWSVTQATVALSSAEAEYSADVKAASAGLGFMGLLGDLGISGVSLHVHTDSSAAIGIANRTGVGKIRHIAVHLLWLQEKLKSGALQLHKVLGARNVADVLTKHVVSETLNRHLPALALTFQAGRASSAPMALIP